MKKPTRRPFFWIEVKLLNTNIAISRMLKLPEGIVAKIAHEMSYYKIQ
jgi:hypothetical protein